MMTNSFAEKFAEMENASSTGQKRINIPSPVGIFYGITTDGYLRLAFMSTIKPSSIDSTKYIKVVQGKETDNVYWTCFDLVNGITKKVFYTFCEDIVSAACSASTEKQALLEIENRYYAWRSMFKNRRTMTSELIQGLYGELMFLYKNLIPAYGADAAVQAWGGPNRNSKDFSINKDWYEVKTILTSASSVKISSLAQLSATDPGKLIVCFVEKMAPEYNDGMATIFDLVSLILLSIEKNEIKDAFVTKLLAYGFDIEDNENKDTFKFLHMNSYIVDDNFPRLQERDIPYPEIINVSYQLEIRAIEKYKE